MKQIIRYILLIISLNFSNLLALSIDTNDLLHGDGIFLNQSLQNFYLNSTHTTTFFKSNSTNILKIKKESTSSVSFTDGLIHKFNDSNPVHISFRFSTESVNRQDTNLRIKDSNSGETLISFRAGNAGLIRVNDNQMVQFYNFSLSTDSSFILTKMDLLIDWNYRQVYIYCNSTYKGTATFYNSHITKVNQLLLYNLSPQGTGYWTDIVICSSNCYGFSKQSITILNIVLILILILINI